MVVAFTFMVGFLAAQQVVAEDISIAVVDQFAAILNTDVAQSLTEKYKVELEAERGKLVALDNEVAELEGRLQKESEVMSQSEMMRLSSDIKDKQLDRNVLIKKLRNRNQDAQQEIVGALGPKLEEVMQEIQEERDFDLILQKQAALWASEKYDITQEVTSKINKLK
jgi:outer membrane protein